MGPGKSDSELPRVSRGVRGHRVWNDKMRIPGMLAGASVWENETCKIVSLPKIVKYEMQNEMLHEIFFIHDDLFLIRDVKFS